MKRFVLSLAVMFITVMLVVVGCDSLNNRTTDPIVDQQEESVDDFVSLRFHQPKLFSELITICEDENLRVEEIRIELDDLTMGYSVGGRELESIKDHFDTEHRKFVSAIREELRQETNDDVVRMYKNVLVLSDKLGTDLPISVVTFYGSEQTMTLQKLGATIDTSIIVSPKENQHIEDIEFNSTENPDSSVILSSRHERWAAYGGRSVITRSYTLQRFIFNNVSDYGFNRTYEHETQIYNRNYANYGGYWSTNMPSRYKDTQFGDQIDNFTVGTSRARNLVANWWYWTYMSLTPGSSSTALCWIRGQTGHRWPNWCYSTWCIYADATTYPGGYAYLALPNYGVCWSY